MLVQYQNIRIKVKTCLFDQSSPQNSVFSVVPGETLNLAIRFDSLDIDQGSAKAYIYSKLFQMIYPDLSLVPVDEACSLPMQHYGERFESQYEFKKFILKHNMGIFSDNDKNEYFCHTDLAKKDWSQAHYHANPIGFSDIQYLDEITDIQFSKTPDSMRIDLVHLRFNSVPPLINSQIIDHCFANKTLPACLVF